MKSRAAGTQTQTLKVLDDNVENILSFFACDELTFAFNVSKLWRVSAFRAFSAPGPRIMTTPSPGKGMAKDYMLFVELQAPDASVRRAVDLAELGGEPKSVSDSRYCVEGGAPVENAYHGDQTAMFFTYAIDAPALKNVETHRRLSRALADGTATARVTLVRKADGRMARYDLKRTGTSSWDFRLTPRDDYHVCLADSVVEAVVHPNDHNMHRRVASFDTALDQNVEAWVHEMVLVVGLTAGPERHGSGIAVEGSPDRPAIGLGFYNIASVCESVGPELGDVDWSPRYSYRRPLAHSTSFERRYCSEIDVGCGRGDLLSYSTFAPRAA